MRLLDELRNYAYSIGIDYLRVTEALPFVEEEAFLRELIAANKYPSLAPGYLCALSSKSYPGERSVHYQCGYVLLAC